jgi:DNA-binding GntR family transcriptional regulator
MNSRSRQLGQTRSSTSRQDEIRQELEAALIDGRLTPGMAIDEQALSARFSTSRTPVREALLLLAAKGLVEIVPRTGIYVRQLNARELVAMMEGLSELEAVLARLAASRCSTDTRKRLTEALKRTSKYAQHNDPVSYAQANADLHELIYQSSSNEFIVEQTRLARLRVAPYRGQLFEKPGRLARSQAEHTMVVNAICAGQPDGAAEAMRTHILAGGQAFTDVVLQPASFKVFAKNLSDATTKQHREKAERLFIQK